MWKTTRLQLSELRREKTPIKVDVYVGDKSIGYLVSYISLDSHLTQFRDFADSDSKRKCDFGSSSVNYLDR